MRFGNHEVWSKIPKHEVNSPRGLEKNPRFYGAFLNLEIQIRCTLRKKGAVSSNEIKTFKIRGQKKKQCYFGNADIGNVYIFIAERGHIKDNRVKGNPPGKSDEKKISNVSGR